MPKLSFNRLQKTRLRELIRIANSQVRVFGAGTSGGTLLATTESLVVTRQKELTVVSNRPLENFTRGLGPTLREALKEDFHKIDARLAILEESNQAISSKLSSVKNSTDKIPALEESLAAVKAQLSTIITKLG